MTPTPNVLEKYTNETFVTTFNVDSVETLASDTGVQRYKLFSCEPSYAYKGGKINGTMTIEDKGDNWFVVRSATSLLPGEYTLNLPSFIHGTQKQTKIEITAKKGNMTYPVIWLQEVETDQMVVDRLSNIGFEADVVLWFLLVNDAKNTTTKDRYDLYVKPMLNLANRFISQLENGKYVSEITDNIETTYHTNLGSTSEYGYLKELFPMPMAGVRIRVTLPIKKKYCQC